MNFVKRSRWLLGALVMAVAGLSGLAGEHRVNARNTYERLLCVVPMVGAGTMSDPRRPLHAPLATLMSPAPLAGAVGSGLRTGILGYTYQLSDDGKTALVEFVAAQRDAFKDILADKTVKAFLKGKDKQGDIEIEFKKHKKDFDIDHFGVRMP